MDAFEQQLRRQVPAKPPENWREEILAAARLASPAGSRAPKPTLIAVLREWLWPHPAAWASLAAIWLVLFSVHRQTESAIQAELIASRVSPREVLESFEHRQQATERLLAGLDFEFPAMDRLKPVRRHPIASPPLMLLAT
jgi:hypothetical protein